MIHVGVTKRLTSTCILWKDPPLSFSVHKDTRDVVAVMKLGRGRRSGRTGVLLLFRGQAEVILILRGHGLGAGKRSPLRCGAGWNARV